MPTYKTKNLPGFEQLLVVGKLLRNTTCGTVVQVEQLVNDVVVIGDRHPKLNLQPGSLYIDEQFLEETTDGAEKEEFTADNPFGQHLNDGRISVDGIEVVFVIYEKAVTVTIIEKNPLNKKGRDKTIYSENFFSFAAEAQELVYDVVRGLRDVEDLVLELQELKEAESNG